MNTQTIIYLKFRSTLSHTNNYLVFCVSFKICITQFAFYFYFRAGKTFISSKCGSKFLGYDVYSKHHETHTSVEPVEAGPSGLKEPTDRKVRGNSAPIPFGDQAPHVQVGDGDDPYRIERTGSRNFARSVATEMAYKVKFNDQSQERRLVDLGQQLNRLFQDLLTRAREGMTF